MTEQASIIERERSAKESNERGSGMGGRMGSQGEDAASSGARSTGEHTGPHKVHIETGDMPDSGHVAYEEGGTRNAEGEHKTGSKRKKKPKKIACRECRQQKARCDAFSRAPGPCSRCAKRKIKCVLDSEYKRTFKRVQIAQMERDYELMRQRLQYSVPVVAGPAGAVLVAPAGGNSGSTGGNQAPYLPLPQILPQTNGLRPVLYPRQPPVLQESLVSGVGAATPASSSTSSTINNDSGALARFPLAPAQKMYAGTGQLAGSIGSSPSPGMAGSPMARNLSPLPRGVTQGRPVAQFRAPAVTQLGQQLPQQLLQHSPTLSSSFSPSYTAPNVVPAVSPRSLGDLTLQASQITELFSHFIRYYQPSLPVVDVSKGIDRIYRLCPILFWTVMSTALRTFSSPAVPKDKARRLYFALSPKLKSALAELSIAPITRYAPSELDEPVLNVCSVYTVQAFLLYTFWPPLTSSISADSSWYSVGIALFQAIRIGLHIPGHSADGLRTNNPQLLREQVRTWIACNVVSQTIATAFGFPSLNRLDLSVGSIPQPTLGTSPVSSSASASAPASVSASGPADTSIIPSQLRQMLEVQRFESRLAQTLNSNSFDPLMLASVSERYPMLLLLETELDQLQVRLCRESEMDDFRLLSLYAARLHLTTYYFFDADKAPGYGLKKGLVKAYNAALAYISHCKASQLRNRGFAKHLPPVYTMTIWQAACVIARLILSPYSSLFDVSRGKMAYLDAVTLSHQASVIKHDMAYRASGIMRCMWALFKTLYNQHLLSPAVVVRSRMCASVFFDSLWILRQKCGMIQLHPEQKEKAEREAAEANEDDDNDENDDELEDESPGARKNVAGGTQTTTTHTNGGNNSAGTDQARQTTVKVTRKKHRSLSESLHPESDVRKIISTIPLDPQPISLSDNADNASSTQSSPFVHGSPNQQAVPTGDHSYGNQNVQTMKKNAKSPKSDTPMFSLDSWDLAKDIDSDLLFKDIDTVMNDFGFHAE